MQWVQMWHEYKTLLYLYSKDFVRFYSISPLGMEKLRRNALVFILNCTHCSIIGDITIFNTA